MIIVIWGLITLAVIVATIGIFMSFIDHPVEQPIRADSLVIGFLLFAIFFLLLAMTIFFISK
jgi:hypothetical protein